MSEAERSKRKAIERIRRNVREVLQEDGMEAVKSMMASANLNVIAEMPGFIVFEGIPDPDTPKGIVRIELDYDD